MSRTFIQRGEELVELSAAPFESEADLQELIASFPELLSAAEESREEAWLLITREVGVQDSEGGPSRWSLDHLFVDRYGVPVLVEVKRSTDTRIRREVVAQMLDYAANGPAFWGRDSIREHFERRCHSEGSNPDDVLGTFIGEESLGEFWDSVAANMTSGRMRLVFVADEIPPELERIVEFLNSQMATTDVLAIEISMFQGAGQDQRVLAPRLIGPSATTERAKGRSSRKWTEDEYRDALAEAQKPPFAGRMLLLLDLLKCENPRVLPGRGDSPSINLRIGMGQGGDPGNPVSISFYLAGIAVNLDFVRDQRSEAEMRRLVELLEGLPGFSDYIDSAEAKGWGLRPTLTPEQALPDDAAVEALFQALVEATRIDRE